MPPADDEWASPVWEALYDKHHPEPRLPWREVVRSTGERGGIAKYGPHGEVTVEYIERIEMETVRMADHELLPRCKPTVRAFWRKMDQRVGASNGEVTEYVYVEWHLNGSVHGRPMTKKDLEKRGMPA